MVFIKQINLLLDTWVADLLATPCVSLAAAGYQLALFLSPQSSLLSLPSVLATQYSVLSLPLSPIPIFPKSIEEIVLKRWMQANEEDARTDITLQIVNGIDIMRVYFWRESH